MDNSGEIIFDLKNIGFSYPMGAPVLSELSLKIFRGDRLCILGANGCGKSTLLKIIAGLYSHQEGTFTAFGSEISTKGMKKEEAMRYHRRIGYVFQDPDVQLFCANVFEEIAFGPLQTGMNTEDVSVKVSDIASSLGIEKLLDKAPYHLSGGEKKKVAIASVIATDPDVMIMDEPTNDLDPRSKAWFLDLLDDLADRGKTIIFATHDLDLVPRAARRAVLMSEDHNIIADDSVDILLRDAELLKSVNLVDEHYHTHPWDFE